MRISNLAKNMLKYLPVLAVLIATVTGLFIGKDLYPASLSSQSETLTQLMAELKNPPPPIVLGEVGPCGFSNVYTSLPPKCKTSDGSFKQANGTSPYISRIPDTK